MRPIDALKVYGGFLGYLLYVSLYISGVVNKYLEKLRVSSFGVIKKKIEN